MQNVSILHQCVIHGLCGLVPLDEFARQMSLHLRQLVNEDGHGNQQNSAANEASLAHVAVAQKKQLELCLEHLELPKNQQVSSDFKSFLLKFQP